MNRILFIIAISCSFTLDAQTYSITFIGTGESTNVSTIKVENLTANTSVNLTGDQILRLNVLTTNVISTESNHSAEIKIYPNPMTDYSTFEICPPVMEVATISVYDMMGKLVAQIQSFLENSPQVFRLSGINSGLYIISVKGASYQSSGKLLSNGKTDGTISIEKIINNNQVVDKKTFQMDHKGIQATVDMSYTIGDRLKFTGISGDYSTVLTDIPASDKTITFPFSACTDGANINYPVVKIGSQIWMAENLRTDKYTNGDLIGTTTPATLDISSESSPKYQWPVAGNESNVVTQGRLYTWYTITDSRKVCPDGWHIPTDTEWTTLTDYLINNGYGYQGSGPDIAKSLAATSGWISCSNCPLAGDIGSDPARNNSSGFSALPGGERPDFGTFFASDNFSWLWSSSEYNTNSAWVRSMDSGDNYVGRSNYPNNKKFGKSVRCLKD